MNFDNRPVMLMPFKSLFLAIILAVILGPVGLVYSTLLGSIIMLVITFICVVLAHITTFALVYLCWIVGVYWTTLATNRYNRKLFEQYKIEVVEENIKIK